MSTKAQVTSCTTVGGRGSATATELSSGELGWDAPQTATTDQMQSPEEYYEEAEAIKVIANSLYSQRFEIQGKLDLDGLDTLAAAFAARVVQAASADRCMTLAKTIYPKVKPWPTVGRLTPIARGLRWGHCRHPSVYALSLMVYPDLRTMSVSFRKTDGAPMSVWWES